MLGRNLNNKCGLNKLDIVSLALILTSVGTFSLSSIITLITVLTTLFIQNDVIFNLLSLAIGSLAISTFIISPICCVILFIFSAIKLFTKNKTKKDYIIILINIVFTCITTLEITILLAIGKIADNIM